MNAEAKTGRWVILLGDEDEGPPVFWGETREALEDMCQVIRRTCPSARIAWQSADEMVHRRSKGSRPNGTHVH